MYKIFLRVQALKVEFEVENSRKIFLCFIHCSSPCTTAWKGRKKEREGQTSLVVQWLILCASTAGGMALIPGQGSSACCMVWRKKKVNEFTNFSAPSQDIPNGSRNAEIKSVERLGGLGKE